MRKTLKKTMCVVLSSAMIFTSGDFSNVNIRMPWDFSFSVEAVDDENIVDETEQVTTAIVKDANLLNELKTIICKNGKTTFTVKEMKEYAEDIVITNTNITSVEGLGYARSAKTIDISKLTKVKEISSYEFFKCGMTEVKLPATITDIHEFAFSSCKQLTTINIPNSVTKIYENAFDKCEKLVNVNKTGEVILPTSLIKLGSFAFANCESLKTITLPNTLKTDISADDQTINTMGSNVFANCTSINSVKFGTSMTSVPAATFKGNTSLREITIPINFIEIGENAFSDSGLTKIDLLNCAKLESIKDYAFSNCHSLEIVKIPAGIKKINDYTFANCGNLKKVEIESGSKIASIGYEAFARAYKLTDVSFLTYLTKLKKIGERAFAESSYETSLPDQYDDYIWEGGPVTVTIPGTVDEIGDEAFIDCRNLSKVTFNDYSDSPTSTVVKRIGNGAFENDWKLTTVKLPNQNETSKNISMIIGTEAFYNCQRLSSINFPKYLTTIGDEAFSRCGAAKEDSWDNDNLVFFGLKNVDLSTNTRLVNIGKEAFAKCVNFDSFKFPSNITKIPDKCFLECAVEDNKIENKFYGLDLVDLGDSVTEIGVKAFSECRKLVLDTTPEDNDNPLPNTLKKIDEEAFSWCSNIGPIVFPENIEIIDDGAFGCCANYVEDASGYSRCIDLKYAQSIPSVNFLNAKKLAYLGSGAFEYTSIDDVTFDKTTVLQSISDDTFYGCTSLKSVFLGDNVEDVLSNAFGACPSLKTVSIPEKATLAEKVIVKKSQSHPTTYAFSLKLRTTGEKITVRENSKDELALYTLIADSDVGGYSAKYSTVKVDSVSYNWDGTQLNTTGNAAALPLTPSVEKQQVRTKGSNNSYYIQKLMLSGKQEKNNIPVTVNISLSLPIDNDGRMKSFSTSVEYTVNVSKVPCKSIGIDDVYINCKIDEEYEAIEVKPFFNPETTTDAITWTADGNDKIIMKVSEDKRSAKFYSNSSYGENSRLGSTKVKITAGNVEKSFYVYICTPSNGLNVDKSRINIPYNSSEVLTAEISYNDSYAGVYADYPDNVKFISSDESIVKVGKVTSKVGSTTYQGNTFSCELIAQKIGKAEITVLAEGSGNYEKIQVAVVAADLSMSLTDQTTGVELLSGSSTQLYKIDPDVHKGINNTARKNYTYKFTSDDLGSNDIEYKVDNEGIVKIEDVSSRDKMLTLVGRGAGKTDVTIWPVGMDPTINGVTITVYVTADIHNISLDSTTVKSGEPISVIEEIQNLFGDVVDENVKDFKTITNNTIVFTSSDETIATVDDLGIVTAKNPGAVTIKCEAVAEDGTVICNGTCTVTCKVGASNLYISDIADQEYTGETIEPDFVVKRGDKILKKGADYDVSWKNNADIGLAKVIVECEGDYEGEVEKIFKIIPRKVDNLRQLNSKGNKVAITWTKDELVDGYEISKYVSKKYEYLGQTDSIKYTADIGNSNNVILSVRSFKNVDGMKLYSNYKNVTVVRAPGKVKLKSLKAGKKKMTIKWKKVNGADGYAIYMSTKKKKGYKRIAFVKGNKKLKYVKKKLKSKKKYYFKVRAYKISGNTNVYGPFSKIKSKKVK